MRQQEATGGRADHRSPTDRRYAAPQVTILGSIDELTLQKAFNASDGASFFGVPEGITGVS